MGLAGRAGSEPPIVVPGDDRMAVRPFDNCRRLGLIKLLPKDHHVAFPVAKDFTVFDVWMTVLDHAALSNEEAFQISGMTYLSRAHQNRTHRKAKKLAIILIM